MDLGKIKLNVVQKKQICVVFCLPGNSFSGSFLDSIIKLIGYCYEKGILFCVSRQYSPVVYYARNLCLGGDNLRGRKQKPFDEKIDYTHLMWIDSDIVFTEKQFESLLNHNKNIVSGLYIMQNNKQFATVQTLDEEHFKKHGAFEFLTREKIEGKKDLIEVAYTGFGFILMKRQVIESLEYPWFRPIFHEIGTCYDFGSEDASICEMIREKGYKIYVDPTIIVGHEKHRILR